MARELLTRASDLVVKLLSDLVDRQTSVRLMSHASSLDLYHFEEPKFYDRLERARLQTTNSLAVLSRLLGMAQDGMTLCSLCAALFVYNPFLLLPLIATALPGFIAETYFATLEYKLFHYLTDRRRQLEYLRFVGASNQTAKEVQLFGLAPWLVSRFQRLSHAFHVENKRLLTYKAMIVGAISVVGTLGYYAAYVIILVKAFNGAISLGELTFLTGTYVKTRDLIISQLWSASGLFSQSLYLKDLFDFFDTKPAITSLHGAPQIPQPIREGIKFTNVSFRYPGCDAWAVRNLNFMLRPGEKIALVGENGAGKTTIVKLLARLYDPTEGSITIDGKNIREYDLQSLRGAIGAIFQDFIRYDWRLDENIGVGDVDKVKPYLELLDGVNSVNGRPRFNGKATKKEVKEPLSVPAAITSAAEKSHASLLLPRLAGGYGQMLGRRFDEGVELSGGEWQKIALGRAYMREAQLLILDEPTAALDARAEYDVFQRFTHLLNERMALIISHRFSTVRMANKIIVLRRGSIIEAGTHDELVAAEGLYAELFALQAEGYM